MFSIWRIEPRFRDHRMAELLHSYEAAEDFVVSRSGFKPWADCQTFPIDVDGKRFFIKYYRHQKAWWRALGRSRPRRERRNMAFFDALGVPTTPPAVYGEERIFGLYGKGGIVVTEGLENCTDMHELGERRPELFRDKVWFDRLCRRLAELVRRLHSTGFCHNDLHWRNVLVRDEPAFEVFILDCPSGRRWPRPMRRFRRIKDLGHLDKLGRRYLSRTQRLRFYLAYVERPRLNSDDKKTIHAILRRFRNPSNREPRNIDALD